VGHRVVHGGKEFTGSVLITEEVIEALERNKNLAPLHNPPNLTGIYATKAVLPEVPWLVFLIPHFMLLCLKGPIFTRFPLNFMRNTK